MTLSSQASVIVLFLSTSLMIGKGPAAVAVADRVNADLVDASECWVEDAVMESRHLTTRCSPSLVH